MPRNSKLQPIHMKKKQLIETAWGEAQTLVILDKDFKPTIFILFYLFFKLFTYLYLFLAALGLRCCMHAFLQLLRAGATLHCSARASHRGGFSFCRAWALGAQASAVVVRGLSSCGTWALEHRLSSCGARAQLLRGMWDLPGPGLEPVSPAQAGGFLTTAPPEKPPTIFK